MHNAPRLATMRAVAVMRTPFAQACARTRWGAAASQQRPPDPPTAARGSTLHIAGSSLARRTHHRIQRRWLASSSATATAIRAAVANANAHRRLQRPKLRASDTTTRNGIARRHALLGLDAKVAARSNPPLRSFTASL